MSLNVLSWNIQSFRSKKSEFVTFLQNNFFHVILLQETWLNDKVQFSIPNYTCLRNDRPSNSQNPHGGVMICVHKSLHISRVFTKKLPFIEAIFAELSSGARKITIGSVYNSSALTTSQSRDDLYSLLSVTGPLVMAGDWNAKHTSWNNTSCNRKGSDLLKICQEKLYDIHFPDSTTLIPYRGDPSIVDFALSKGILGISKPISINEGRSDHWPISFHIPFAAAMPANVKIKDFARADWRLFRNTVATEISSLSLNKSKSIDERVEILSRSIENADKAAIPVKTPLVFRYPSSLEIKDLISSRNRLRKASIVNPALKSEVNRLNRLIKIKTANLNADHFNKKLSSLKTADLSLFRFAKAIKRKQAPLPPMKSNSNEIVYSNKEKADLLANAFLSSHKIPQNDTCHSQIISNSIASLRVSEIFVPNYELIKFSELKKDIKLLKVRKASGDDVTNRHIKALPDIAIKFLTEVFNDCLRLGHFPKRWKIGKVIALSKPGKDSSIPSNNRPITLLSAQGKLFERTILSKLRMHEEDEKVFIPQQFGFRGHHSTIKQIIRITEKISLRFNENKSTAMTMLDLEKAFDSVWHDALIHKMMDAKYPIFLVKIIQSFLTDRFSLVAINDSLSDSYHVPAGVPQGSPLSPHLFNIFINDIPIPAKCKLALFADDSALLTSIKNNSGSPNLSRLRDKLQNGLEEVNSYFTSWKMKLNSSKTEAIVFSKSLKVLRNADQFPISFDNAVISWSNPVRYLGGFLDSKLTFKFHIETVIAKAKKAIGILYCFLKKFSYVKTNIKIMMYKLYIRPIFTYAAPMLANAARTHIQKLQVLQNKCLRMVLSSPYDTRIVDLHSRAEVISIEAFVEKLTEKFYNSCASSSNALIKDLGSYASDPTRKFKHKMPRRQDL